MNTRREALGIGAALLAAALWRRNLAAAPRIIFAVVRHAAPEEMTALTAWKTLAATGSVYAAAKAVGNDATSQWNALLRSNDVAALNAELQPSVAELALRADLCCPLIASGPVEALHTVVPESLSTLRFSAQGMSRCTLPPPAALSPALEMALQVLGQSARSSATALALRETIAAGLLDPGSGADKVLFTAVQAANRISTRMNAPLTTLLLDAPEDNRSAWFAGLDRGLAEIAATTASLLLAALPRPVADAKEPPRMALLFCGPAFKSLGLVRNGGSSLDVAPTVAHALGLKLQGARGNVLRAVLA